MLLEILSFKKASSNAAPTNSIKLALALKLISLKLSALTYSIISLSSGGTICPPSLK